MLGTTTRTVEVDAGYLSQSAYGRVRLGMDCNIARTGLALVLWQCNYTRGYPWFTRTVADTEQVPVENGSYFVNREHKIQIEKIPFLVANIQCG